MKEVFEQIYAKNAWGNGSGPGSDPESCQDYLEFLKLYYGHLHAFEIGCGDMRMYARVGIPFKSYLGLDLLSFPVWEKITQGNANHRFNVYDGAIHNRFFDVDSLDNFSVILIKDVLNHLPNDHIVKMVDVLYRNRALRAHIVLTHDYSEELPTTNTDIAVGEHRPLSLTERPFLFPYRFKFKWLCTAENRFKETVVL